MVKNITLLMFLTMGSSIIMAAVIEPASPIEIQIGQLNLSDLDSSDDESNELVYPVEGGYFGQNPSDSEQNSSDSEQNASNSENEEPENENDYPINEQLLAIFNVAIDNMIANQDPQNPQNPQNNN